MRIEHDDASSGRYEALALIRQHHQQELVSITTSLDEPSTMHVMLWYGSHGPTLRVVWMRMTHRHHAE